jgi:iron complex outermembrane receptor protein
MGWQRTQIPRLREKIFMLYRASLVASISLLALSTPAFAQDATTSATAEQAPEDTGDIIVTATRSETLLSKTPIAMTAISGEGLREAGVTDSTRLNDLVPNLQISATGDAARISIRGVTSTDNTEKGDPSAAFLLDGVYLARPIEALNSFYDLARVEVLRGPQGTLYGRNTTAGVINVIAARPTDQFEGSVSGTYGSLGTVNATGMINLPVGEGLGIRAAVNYDRKDSPIIQSGPVTQSLEGFRNVLSARLSFGGEIGDNFNFVIRGDYTEDKGGLYNQLPLGNFFPTIISPGASTAQTMAPVTQVTLRNPVDPLYVPRSSTVQRTLTLPLVYPDRKDNKFYGIAGEFTYDLGPASLTYLGSYRETKRRDVRDLLVFGFLHGSAFLNGDFNQSSHELRASFGKDGPIRGQVGAYYFQEESDIFASFGQPIAGLFGPAATGFAFPQGPTKARSIAGFGQLTFDITQDLHLTGGIRYTSDKKSRVGATVVDFPSAAVSFCGAARCVLNENIAERTFKKTTWKVGIDYDAPNLGLIYANVSSGYKAGGFNDGCVTGAGIGCGLTPALLYYNPETLVAYEAGFKFRLLDNALRLNVSAFHYDYSNLQLSQIATLAGVPQVLVQNAGTAKVDGIEMEAIMKPSDRDTIQFAINYTDARYDNFAPSIAVDIIGPGGTAVGTTKQVITRNFHGLQLDHAPKWTASAGYTHSFPIGDGGSVDASVRTRLSSSYVMQDLSILGQFRQPSFTKTDLSLTYKAPEDRWYIQGYAQNIEDTITLSAVGTGLLSGATIEEPRTYGVRAGFKF